VSALRLMALGCLPCVRCARLPTLGMCWGPDWPGISCSGCYDGAEDSGSRNEFVYASTVAVTVALWNNLQRESLDPLFTANVDELDLDRCVDEHTYRGTLEVFRLDDETGDWPTTVQVLWNGWDLEVFAPTRTPARGGDMPRGRTMRIDTATLAKLEDVAARQVEQLRAA
jgi:hypothetical protein